MEALAGLRAQALERSLAVNTPANGRIERGGEVLVNFASNDYLGLARHPEVVAGAESALRQYGTGAASSRLVTGTLPCHEALETALAELKGHARALVFSSGYHANLAAVTALAGRGDCVFLDRLCHASLIDGAILSRADLRRFGHNDAGHLDDLLKKAPARCKRLVVTESVFSMDGDTAPLQDICRVAEARGAMLMVDEAHATGVQGPGGAGLISKLGLQGGVNLGMGTLSKALGGLGGFLACSETMMAWLVNVARPFIFSTALPPAAAGAALAALAVLKKQPGLGASLLERAARFRARLNAAGIDTGSSTTQIVPVMAGSNQGALDLAAALRARGIFAAAIRPPTVPDGTARIRLSITLEHSPDVLDRAADAIIECAGRAR